MRFSIVVTFFVALVAAYGLSQNQTPTTAQAACGALNVRFDTKTTTSQPPAQPDPDKALVFVAQDFKPLGGVLGATTIKVGVDGAWMGATHGYSHIFFMVDPGEHHLCIEVQSHLQRFSNLAFAHLTAEPGKTYYFRTRQIVTRTEVFADLDRIDSDEGIYLVNSTELSTAHAKK